MARRKASGGRKKSKTARKTSPRRRSAARPKAARRRKAASRPKKARKNAARKPRAAPRPARARSAARPKAVRKAPRLNRARRTLDDNVPTPPSSLDMKRQGSAARTGRAELEESRQLHGSMSRGITGGDVDVNLDQAYFSGDETPGGDNPTPDQDIVDNVGRALGVEYQDNEELRASDKVAERDKHRWELDPASAEDYKERK